MQKMATCPSGIHQNMCYLHGAWIPTAQATVMCISQCQSSLGSVIECVVFMALENRAHHVKGQPAKTATLRKRYWCKRSVKNSWPRSIGWACSQTLERECLTTLSLALQVWSGFSCDCAARKKQFSCFTFCLAFGKWLPFRTWLCSSLWSWATLQSSELLVS